MNIVWGDEFETCSMKMGLYEQETFLWRRSFLLQRTHYTSVYFPTDESVHTISPKDVRHFNLPDTSNTAIRWGAEGNLQCDQKSGIPATCAGDINGPCRLAHEKEHFGWFVIQRLLHSRKRCHISQRCRRYSMPCGWNGRSPCPDLNKQTERITPSEFLRRTLDRA